VNRKTILSALLLATAASMSAGVFATDNDMPMASEASGALAAAPAEDTKGRDKSKHFHPDTK